MVWDRDPAANAPGESTASLGAREGLRPTLPLDPSGFEAAQQEQKLQTIGLLATGIAHDFNNLLTAVLGNASLLDELIPAGHPQRDILDGIISGSEQAAELARRLLSYTRTTAPSRSSVDLNELARDAHSLLRRILGEGVRLELDLEPQLQRVAADGTQISQVLVNLIVNARDALPGNAGRICVRTCNSSYVIPGTQHSYAVLEVEDDGVGMDSDTCARVFDPFFSTKHAESGTGLGLSIVEAIVRRHGGYIAMESEPGRGTQVRVYLPIAAAGRA